MSNNSPQELRDLLLRSFDEELNTNDAQRLQAALLTEAWLLAEREEFLLLRSALSDLHPAPNAVFTQQVMENFRTEKQVLRPLLKLWPAMAAAACMAIAISLGFIYSSTGSLDTATILGIDQLEMDDVYVFEN